MTDKICGGEKKYKKVLLGCPYRWAVRHSLVVHSHNKFVCLRVLARIFSKFLKRVPPGHEDFEGCWYGWLVGEKKIALTKLVGCIIFINFINNIDQKMKKKKKSELLMQK
jgi:hypothetical protein